MSDIEKRLRHIEALNLITNRVMMDYLSLQVDAGKLDLRFVKNLLEFSRREVLRGAPKLESEVNLLTDIFAKRFDETYPQAETDDAQPNS